MKYNFTHLVTRPTAPRTTLAGIFAGLFSANTTYNYRGGYVQGSNVGIPSTPGSVNVAEIKLDFAAIAAARTAAGMAALVATDILELFAVPAGVWVPATFAETLTVEGEAATVSMGDGVTPAGFMANFDANALGMGNSLVTTPYSLAVGGGKVYTVADTIDAVLNTAAFNVAKVRLLAVMVDLRAQR